MNKINNLHNNDHLQRVSLYLLTQTQTQDMSDILKRHGFEHPLQVATAVVAANVAAANPPIPKRDLGMIYHHQPNHPNHPLPFRLGDRYQTPKYGSRHE